MNALLRPLSCAIAALALASASLVHAQAAAPAPLPAPDAEKQKVIDRILASFHPEVAIVQAAQRPGIEAMQKSVVALQAAHVPKDRMDKTMKDIGTDVQKYIDTTTPIVAASAKKFTSQAVGPLLAQSFSVDELKQLAAMFESPLKDRFDKLVPQLETAIGQKVQADVAPQVNKNIQAMTEAVGTKLRVAATLN
jgi:hypothetical protein